MKLIKSNKQLVIDRDRPNMKKKFISNNNLQLCLNSV